MEYFLSLVILALFSAYVIYRNPELARPTAVASVAFLLYGTLWDYIAISRGWWYYGDAFLLGHKFLGIPLEDFIFMIVLPAAIISAYHIAKTGEI